MSFVVTSNYCIYSNMVYDRTQRSDEVWPLSFIEVKIKPNNHPTNGSSLFPTACGKFVLFFRHTQTANCPLRCQLIIGRSGNLKERARSTSCRSQPTSEFVQGEQTHLCQTSMRRLFMGHLQVPVHIYTSISILQFNCEAQWNSILQLHDITRPFNLPTHNYDDIICIYIYCINIHTYYDLHYQIYYDIHNIYIYIYNVLSIHVNCLCPSRVALESSLMRSML